MYDLASEDIGFNISAQIITFEYNEKEYLVETWKGDYWGAASCEIELLDGTLNEWIDRMF